MKIYQQSRYAFYFFLALFIMPYYGLSLNTGNITKPDGAVITDPNSINRPNVSACYNTTTVEVQLNYTENGNGTLTLNMPSGVQYINNSVAVVSSSTGNTISQTTFSATNPTFNLGNVSTTDDLLFSFQVSADCDANFGTNSIGVDVTVNTTSSGTVNIDVLAADLSVSGHANQTIYANQSVTVPLDIENGGLGSIDSIIFFIDESGNTNTTALTVNGTSILPAYNTVGSRKYYLIPPTLIPGGALGNTEKITVMRSVTLTTCPINDFTFYDEYGTTYGCNNNTCQTDNINFGTFNAVEGEADYVLTYGVVQKSNFCNDVITSMTFTNQGTGELSLAQAYNNIFYYGTSAGSSQPYNWQLSSWTVTDVLIKNSLTGTYSSVPFTGGAAGLQSVTIDASNFASDPDGVGVGLEDIDGDLQFDDLAVGEEVEFRFVVQYNCSTTCGSTPLANIYGQVDYDRTCETDLYEFIRPFYHDNTQASFYPLAVTPDVSDGETATAQVCLNKSRSVDTYVYDCPTDSLRITMTAFNATISAVRDLNGVAIPYIVSGGDVIVTLKSTQCFEVDFIGDCGALGSGIHTTGFTYQVDYICDHACACEEPKDCGTVSTELICTVPCATGGLTVTQRELKRTTLGFTDETGNTYVDANTLPASNLRRGQVCDSVMLTVRAVQVTGSVISTGTSAYFEFYYDQFSGNNRFDWQNSNITASVYRGGSLINGPTAASLYYDGVDGTQHVAIVNATSAIPAGGLQGGDEIEFQIEGVVLNNSYSATLTQVPSFILEAFNLTAGNTNALRGGDTRYDCLPRALEFYLRNADPELDNEGSEYHDGCKGEFYDWDLEVQGSSLGPANVDYYPGEIRPSMYLDSIVFTMPNSLHIDSDFRLITYSGGDRASNTTRILTPDRVVTIAGFSYYYFVNDGSWALPEDVYWSGNFGDSYQFDVYLQATCTTPTGGSIAPGVEFHYRKNANSAEESCWVYEMDSDVQPTYFNYPEFSLSSDPIIAVGDEKTECYNVTISEVANEDAYYAWLAIDEVNTGSDLISIKDLSNNNYLTLKDYPDGQFVELRQYFYGNQSYDYEICFQYDDCTNDPFMVEVGWNCQGYPTNPAAENCNSTLDSLRITPADASVQIDFVTQPTTTVDLCTDLVYDIRVNSAQTGNIIDPRLLAKLPTGLMLQSAEIEYPINSGTFQTVTPTSVSGDSIWLYLAEHPMVFDSLPGTSKDNNALGGDDRQALIRLTFSTTCDFTSGDIIPFQVFAERPCGDAARGSSNKVISNPIKINGITEEYITIFGLDVGLDTVITCDNQTIDVSLSIVDIASDAAPSTVDPSRDSIEVILPTGTAYVPNSFTCTTGGANCPTLSRVEVNGNQTRLWVGYPTINLSNGSQVDVDFTFDINAYSTVNCETAGNMTIRSLRETANISCPSLGAGATCPNPIQSINGRVDTILSIQQMELNNLTATLTSFTASNYSIDGSFDVNTTDLPSGENLVVEVFCTNGSGTPIGNPIGTTTINGPITAGNNVPYSVTATNNCSEDLYITVQRVSNSGDILCVCSPTTVLLPICNAALLPLGNSSKTTCSGIGLDSLSVSSAYAAPNSIVFKYFTSPQTDVTTIYASGTTLGTAAVTSYGQAKITNVNFPNNGTGAPLTYYVYAIVTPTPSDANCRPIAEFQVTVNPSPTISAVTPTNPTCPSLNDGQITITASAGTWEYSINNGASFQPSNVFNNLIAGGYNIIVRLPGNPSCSVNDSAVLTAPGCVEDCVNGVDDDGDGLIDCDDPDCAAGDAGAISGDD